MCESAAYMVKNGKEELAFESIDLLENRGDEVVLTNIFGEQKRLKARIRRLSLVDHKILLEPIE